MELPISRAALTLLTSRFNRDIIVADTVSTPLQANECPEQFGDELRQWCSRRCQGRWKQIGRGAQKTVVIGLESLLDAAMFRESAVRDCLAVIGGNRRRCAAH